MRLFSASVPRLELLDGGVGEEFLHSTRIPYIQDIARIAGEQSGLVCPFFPNERDFAVSGVVGHTPLVSRHRVTRRLGQGYGVEWAGRQAYKGGGFWVALDDHSLGWQIPIVFLEGFESISAEPIFFLFEEAVANTLSIKPSKADGSSKTVSFYSHQVDSSRVLGPLRSVRQWLKQPPSMTPEGLIRQLNPILRGWARYYWVWSDNIL
jgi:hypothetical protein